MVLDSSAIVAIFLKEPGHGALIRKLAAAKLIGVGAPTLVETGIVLSVRLGRDPWPLLARFLWLRRLQLPIFFLPYCDLL